MTDPLVRAVPRHRMSPNADQDTTSYRLPTRTALGRRLVTSGHMADTNRAPLGHSGRSRPRLGCRSWGERSDNPEPMTPGLRKKLFSTLVLLLAAGVGAIVAYLVIDDSEPAPERARGRGTSPAAVVRVLADCQHLSARPTEVILTCADANTVADHLRWEGWGQTVAVAEGRVLSRHCQPDCAPSHSYDVYPVVLVERASESAVPQTIATPGSAIPGPRAARTPSTHQVRKSPTSVAIATTASDHNAAVLPRRSRQSGWPPKMSRDYRGRTSV